MDCRNVDYLKLCTKVIHLQKYGKTLKNQVMHKVIHIIHKDNNVEDLIYIK